ncbi:RDD family protein [Actinomadura fulvescens]|uniref:RDD domain-containing protein n=1 Tax=Actinomadura fulvescens TaxID=46160 RepID=A0ABN3PIC5_9ACTN
MSTPGWTPAPHPWADPRYAPPPAPRPADFGKRFAARLLDLVFAGLLTVIVNLVIVGVGEAAGFEWVYLLAANMIVLPILYEAVQLGAWHTTLGKRVVGLTVVRTGDGAPVGWARAGGRALLMSPYFSLFLALMVIPLVSLVWMLADAPERRGLHGRATGTTVLDTRPPQPVYASPGY